MVLVTFREAEEQLTSMFHTVFSSVEEAKKFIKEDAEHWIKTHGLEKHAKLVNISETDHFEVINEYGYAVLTYQYFEIH